MPKQVRTVYEFAPYRVDPTERLLWREDECINLTPKALDTLIVLVENSKHIMTKDELMELIWPDTYVEEANLAQHISMLRKALGEKAGGGQYIETVPRRGYRFTVAVKKIQHQPTKAYLTLAALHRQALQATMPPEAATAEVPIGTIQNGTKLGRYEIVSRIGVGGMGEVYAARDTQLERRVALKLLSHEYTQNQIWLKRFRHEAKAASALNHPNIVTIHEIGAVGGVHFMATELIEGHTLRQRLSQGRMKLAQALQFAGQIAAALDAAHHTGIVHRDIKPENVMVRPDGYVKVLDFGLAKTTTATPKDASFLRTDPGTVMGTVNYMSPEQARGLDVDARSDIFSLGIVLYEMLLGRTPFDGPTASDVMAAILEHEPPRLIHLLPGSPAELERIVSKALRKDREERYQTAKDLQLDLKQLQQELELQARLSEMPQGVIKATPSATPAFQSRENYLIPEVHYTLSGEVNIAYQVIGDGPLDIVFVMGWVSHLEWFWKEPSFAKFLNRLASFARVVLFDKRGTGLSDRVPLNELPTLEQRMDDVRAVMEAAGSERAVLCGVSEGGPMSCLFSATYPEKTSALVMIGSYARRLWAEDYPWGPTEAQREHFFEELRHDWGGPVGIDTRAPSLAEDPAFRDWWATYLRMGASPGAALTLTKMNAEIDVRPILASIRVPTLVIHRTGDMCLRVEEGRYLAEQIPGAKFIELPGNDHLPFVGDQETLLDEIEEFLTGVRHATEADRVLATVLITRAVGSAANISRFDDPRWREQLARHQSLHQAHAAREIEMFKGRALTVAGDRVVALFDGPARAIRAACAISDSAGRLGIKLQAGLHTGECSVFPDHAEGTAVEIAEQIASHAATNEVLVSNTVKDLVAGSGLNFVEHDAQVFGKLGEWRLYAVERGRR
jgi:serine/threonine protein kinase/DNA-binding winged helix-turn-helix (wHTH) protein/class 3 adenylate cyclase/alpha-beta hydrolase superfamily lysophospholipase